MNTWSYRYCFQCRNLFREEELDDNGTWKYLCKELESDMYDPDKQDAEHCKLKEIKDADRH